LVLDQQCQAKHAEIPETVFTSILGNHGVNNTLSLQGWQASAA
jgi:hypothetical protein